ncbi:MAG TPA: carboxypeptidase regulatory-like domain-containing protein [Pyrinomonadaceae bacterium]|nr:carboxypeptidase regulatory-like domain-containing protein [Pyrinomonadaceae bacterium]
MRTLAYICLILCAALCLADAGTARAQSAARGRIAYTSPAGNTLDLFVYDLDTGARTNVTQGRLAGFAVASWSPDGTRFVISADRGSNLYVIGADGTGLRALTQNAGFAITQTPTWSPDGSQIAFVCEAATNYDICLVNADGSNRRRLTNTASVYRDLAWSPDGKSIAYAGGPDFFHTKIFVMNADGTLPRQLSTGEGTDLAPAWSPEGSRIAFEKDLQSGPAEIFVMNADGTGQLRLTNDFRSDRHPTWSPDGKTIAFASDRTGTSAVYLMSPDGSGQTRATSGTDIESAPAWQPNPSLALPDPTPTPVPVYSVSGRVTDSGGAPVAGVRIDFELNQQGAVETRTALTDAAGNYTSGELGCRNGVKVTPSKAGLSFTPQALSFVSTNCLSGSGTANFVAAADSGPRHSISGRVTDGRGTGIADATVTLTGTVSGATTTDAAGNYSFAGLPAGGGYALSPSKPGQFIRFAFNVSSLNADQTVELRLLPYVTVFARVTDAAGNALAGVAVRQENAFGGPLTNSNGTVNYSITYPLGSDTPVKLIPSKYGYVFNPSEVSFGTASGNQSFSFTATLVSPIYDTQFFVRQHYADFLNREPDSSGLNFWAQGIDTCGTIDGCREVKRIDTSAAFFLSIEFQRTGFLAYCARRAAYGDLPGKPVPLTFAEFLADTRQLGEGVVVGPDDGWQARLAANQTAYFQSFVSSERFLAKYPAGLDEDTFTNALYTSAGVAVTAEDLEASRQAFGSMSATAARAFVLQRLAEKESLRRRETNRAFVLMQYFGYLRRDPDAGPDTDFNGYNHWLSKLEEFGGDYRRAEMVKAFLDSVEYRDRFKQP